MKELSHRNFKIFFILAGCLFVILVGLHLHGFSIPEWDLQLNGTRSDSLLLGETRGERGDDWLVNASNALAQISHKPAFPLVNSNIGSGQNMAVFPSSPILHPVGIFRPWSWGFFLGPGFGFSWHWWWRVIGLLSASVAFFGILSKGRFYVSLAAGLGLLFAPFTQFWSLNNSEVQTTALACVVFFICLLQSITIKSKFIWSTLLGWMGVCFVNTLYPAYQIVLGYFFIAAAVGWILSQTPSDRRAYLSNWKWLLFALSIFSLGVGILYASLSDVLPLITRSSYPGTRFENGGNFPFTSFFSILLLNEAKGNSAGPWIGNWSEAAGYYGIFVGHILIAFCSLFWARRSKFPLTWVFGSYVTVLCIYMLIGFPPWLATISKFSQVPATRAIIGFGLGTFSLAIALHREFMERNWSTTEKKWLILICCLAVLAEVVLFTNAIRYFHANIVSIYVYNIVVMGALLILISAFLYWRLSVGLTLLAALGAYTSYWYNPLVKDGTQILFKNPLSAKMAELNAERPNGKWVVMHTIYTTELPKILGIPSITGVMFPGHVQLWKAFDPDGAQLSEYNRYAHVGAKTQSVGQSPKFSAPVPDTMVLFVHPDDAVLKANSVDFILVAGSDDTVSNSKCFKNVYNYRYFKIYERQICRS